MDLFIWMLPAGFTVIITVVTGWFLGVTLEKSPLWHLVMVLSVVWAGVYFVSS